MMFNYIANFYVSEHEIEEMLSYCKQGYSYEQSIRMVANNWEDDCYDNLDSILSQLVKELERRLEAERG